MQQLNNFVRIYTKQRNGLSKQAQEVIFTRKVKKVVFPPVFFNNKPVEPVHYKQHLGLTLDTSLTFDEHIKEITSKVSKLIGLLWKLNNSLPWCSLTTMYKSFMRPHIDYGDVIVEKTYNNSFQQRLEFLQYISLYSFLIISFFVRFLLFFTFYMFFFVFTVCIEKNLGVPW